MRYVVIEDFNDIINLIANPENGMTMVFDTIEEAQEVADECQNGKIIDLD